MQILSSRNFYFEPRGQPLLLSTRVKPTVFSMRLETRKPILKGEILMARKKKKTPVEELQELSEQLEERHERWHYIKTYGTTDPFWPDGVNINLVRNHCSYYRRLIKELCDKHGLSVPIIYEKPVPPKMPQDFMATNRVCRWLQQRNVPQIITHPVQLSLF